jgi:hypothetical protein
MDLRRWLNKENKIRSLLRILFFFYASKCSNQSLWHFAGEGTGLPKGGPMRVAEQRKKKVLACFACLPFFIL